MYVPYIYIYIHIHTYTYTYVYIYIYTHVYIYIYIYREREIHVYKQQIMCLYRTTLLRRAAIMNYTNGYYDYHDQ